MINIASAGKLASNSVLNFFGGIFPFFVSFLCVPFFIELVGAETYGILSIFLISTVYLSFLDLGIPRAIVQRTARAQGGLEGANLHPFVSGLWLCAITGVISFCLVYSLGHVVIQLIFEESQVGQREMAASIVWLALAIPVIVITNVLNGFLQASDGFFELNLITAASSVVTQVSPLIVAAYFGPYLPHLLAAIVVARMAMLPMLWLACYRRGARVAPYLFRNQEAIELLRFGGWATVSSVVGPLMLVSDRYAIGALRGAVPVTQYSVPFQLAQGLMTLPVAIQTALFPALAAANDQVSASVSWRATRLMAVLMLLLVGSAILLADLVLPLLMRGAYVAQSADVARIALLGVWANAVAYIPASQLQAKGFVRFIAVVHLIELPPYALVLYFGIVKFGLVGAAVAFTLRCVIDGIIFHRVASGDGSDWRALGIVFLCLVVCCVFASNVTAFSNAWLASTPIVLAGLVGVGLSLTTPQMRAPFAAMIRSWFRPR